DKVCWVYTRAFMQYVLKKASKTNTLAIGGDLRNSTARIMAACAHAAQHGGWTVINCGRLPSPALALYATEKGIPSVMVTGSHIPEDRNGIKFNMAQGEITKDDEAGIRSQVVEIPAGIIDVLGGLTKRHVPPPVKTRPLRNYAERYINFFGIGSLHGLRIGLYEHSTVGRDIAHEVLAGLGAKVTPFNRSELFVPVDTEAIRKVDVELARRSCFKGQFDAIVSMDGDGDRPLLSDERGTWIRGDVLGILAAKALGITRLAVPVSCNTAVELSKSFEKVERTRIGSPYVIEAMSKLAKVTGKNKNIVKVAGYEANGGFLLQSSLEEEGQTLSPLPTRDALLPLIAVLRWAHHYKVPVSALLGTLPPRFTSSNRLKEFPTELGQARVAAFGKGNKASIKARAKKWFPWCGALTDVEKTDGLRMTFDSGDIVHLRPSGNAPELRCYCESGAQDKVEELTRKCLEAMNPWRDEAVAI
ncbi:MAG TPA: phosphomannomutase, partial [Fibrobacteraceae bacterium]|nr:phosphomannomutase [Fibrobacteraceae bacterium]